jgi:hypothetical protein
MAGLAALVHASQLRFDFLSSAPSFLSQLLAFSATDVEPNLLISLFQETKKLLSIFDEVSGGIGKQLMRIWREMDSNIKPHVIACLAEAMRFPSAQAEISTKNWTQLLSSIGDSKSVIINFFSGSNPTANDAAFVAKLFERKGEPDIWAVITELVNMPRFVPHIMANLPIGNDTRTASVVYPPLFRSPEFYPALMEIPEFYAVASYFIASGDAHMISHVLKRATVNVSILQESRLCEFLAQAISSRSHEEDLIHLLAAVFSISRVVQVPVFMGLIVQLSGFLRDDNYPHLKMPAFLCLGAMSAHRPDGIDYPLLVLVASDYVNSDSSLIQEYGAKIMKSHLRDVGVDVNGCASVFLGSYKSNDDYTRTALRALKRASRGGNLSASVSAQLSLLWKNDV